MARCHENRRKRKVRRNRERKRIVEQYHRFISWVPPYNVFGGKRPKNVPDKVRKHFKDRSDLNLFRPLRIHSKGE